MSFDDEYRIKGSKYRREAVHEGAQYLAATEGGEVEDHLKEADRLTDRDPRWFKDDDLTGAGFVIKAIYRYTDPDGNLLYQSLRYEHGSVPGVKKFKQRRVGPLGYGVSWVADAGLIKVPYQWPEIVKRPDETIHWCEGEKDADRLASLGLLASTAAGQKLSPLIAKAMTGHPVVIYEDNDDVGRQHAKEALEAFQGFASSVRIVRLPDLPQSGDVSDWLDAGNTVEELQAIVEGTRVGGIEPTPAQWIAPKDIPLRRWLYAPSYIRQFLSVLVSHGGMGKSSLALVEALAIITCRPLLNIQPSESNLRVWYWNGEDPMEEVQRRFVATCMHYGITKEEVDGRLFLDSGRTMPIVIAELDPKTRNVRVSEPTIQRIIDRIKRNKIDVVIIDPFVKCHRAPENDNGAMNAIAEAWARVADEANCSVLLVHHTRKGNGEAYTIDDARGAVSLVDASRSARVLNKMTKDEASKSRVDPNEAWRYLRSDNGKASLTRRPEHSDWYRLTSVDLGNAPEWAFGLDSDDVGVVTPWAFEVEKEPEMGSYRLSAVRKVIEGGRWRMSPQSTNEPWIGICIAGALGVDLADDAKKDMVKSLVKKWLENGWLQRVKAKGTSRTDRPYIEIGPAWPSGDAGASLDGSGAVGETENGR